MDFRYVPFCGLCVVFEIDKKEVPLSRYFHTILFNTLLVDKGKSNRRLIVACNIGLEIFAVKGSDSHLVTL